MKTDSFVNFGVEISNLLVSKITTPESDGVKSQGSRISSESMDFIMTLESMVGARVKFCRDSGIKVESE